MFTPDSGTSHLNMPTFAFASLMEATESWDDKPCYEGANKDFGNLTFVIDGISYDLPSHHWANRDVDESNIDGGTCHLNVKTLDINQNN